ncbi:MAG: anaerobic ribonucleoside-triphosphate reductase activating protein [Clostridia bacterium]|nr:anaerobic ribonucleoside-triphosphate reductase activating protein [Clostridia bacterium]
MYYGAVKKCDIANGPGVRVSLFVSGCRNRCKNCFQPETWAFDYGNEFTPKTQDEIIKMLIPSYISGLTVLGGEPFECENQKELLPFLKRVKKEFPNKTIWAFTGFTFEELRDAESRAYCEETEEILCLIDVLVDGRFVEEKKDITLKFRGSSNQRIIDLKKTLFSKEIVLWQG